MRKLAKISPAHLLKIRGQDQQITKTLEPCYILTATYNYKTELKDISRVVFTSHKLREHGWTRGGNRQCQFIHRHTVRHPQGVNAFVRSLSCQQLPQNYSVTGDQTKHIQIDIISLVGFNKAFNPIRL